MTAGVVFSSHAASFGDSQLWAVVFIVESIGPRAVEVQPDSEP
jgi:hypothetical protein